MARYLARSSGESARPSKDRTARCRKPGDVEPVGEGVSELRINYGPGYRVYFKKRGRELIILLAGGDKGTQAKDIKAALRLARNLSEQQP
jgi:putative addiction module killer protein